MSASTRPCEKTSQRETAESACEGREIRGQPGGGGTRTDGEGQGVTHRDRLRMNEIVDDADERDREQDNVGEREREHEQGGLGRR